MSESVRPLFSIDATIAAKESECACEDAIKALEITSSRRRILSLYKQQLKQIAGLSRLVACNGSSVHPQIEELLQSITALVQQKKEPKSHISQFVGYPAATKSHTCLDELNKQIHYINLSWTLEQEKGDLLRNFGRLIGPNRREWNVLFFYGLDILPKIQKYYSDFRQVIENDFSEGSERTPDFNSLNIDLTDDISSQPADGFIEFEKTVPHPYRHLQQLGSGKFSKVDKVKDERNGMIFARKTYTPSSLDRAKKALRQEVENLKYLRRICQHHHIVEVILCYQWRREISLILRPAARSDLRHVLGTRELGDHEPGLNLDTFLPTTFGCLAHAVWYIHSHNMRHRDIKPENILVHEGVVILADFGISKQFFEKGSKTSGEPEMTRKYCAPEVSSWENRGRAADIFSLGCVYLEILACLLGHSKDVLAELIDLNDDWNDDGIYHKNLPKIRDWLKTRETTISNICQQTTYKLILGMLDDDPKNRPIAGLILGDLFEASRKSVENTIALFCANCSNAFEQADRLMTQAH